MTAERQVGERLSEQPARINAKRFEVEEWARASDHPIASYVEDVLEDQARQLAEAERETDELPSAEELARFFHNTYERNAGTVGYETRPESRTAWENVPEPNRALMLLTAADVLAWLKRRAAPATEKDGGGDG